MWATVCLLTVGCQSAKNGVTSGSQPVEKRSSALSGENLAGANLAGANLAGNNLAGANLAGTNLAGANLGGSNLAGNNLAGNNLAGTNLAGNNLAGSNLAGSNLAGANLAGNNLAGNNLAGSNLAGSNLAGSNLAGANLAGNNLAGTNLAGSNLAGANSGLNIHGLAGDVSGMLYSGEDIWGSVQERCVVMGIGSSAFAKLLGQQTANAQINVALGKLPWGFTATSGAPAALKAWEAVVWGDRTYCSFVLVAPNDATWAGVAGFIKAVFRWQAAPAQVMQISGIEASAPHDSTLSTSIYTYTGMMDTAAKFRAGLINDKNLVAGEVAFVSATTNNQSVMVDFASWVMDSTNTGLVLGNVQSVNPPTRAESVYYAVDNGDGTVSVRIAAAGSGLTTVSDTYEALNADWQTYQDNLAPKPVPRRCGGALFLNYYYSEPVPAGKCDDGLTWANASSAADSRKWSTVAGTTAPMNSYMLLPKDSTHPLKRGVTADDLQVVLSETYVHTWDAASDLASGLTVIDDSVQGTGLNQFNYVDNGVATWGHSTSGTDAFKNTNSYQGSATSYATFTFQATQIQLYLVQDPGHGIGAISIDNGPETMVDMYSPTRKAYQLMWAASALYPGVNHTLKVRATGTKDPRATGTNVAIDAVVLSNAASCTIEPDSSFCARQGKNCGSVTAIDNCGATRTVAFCGSCVSPLTCGGAGEDNVCGNGSVVDDYTRGTSSNQFNQTGSWSTCRHCGNGSLYGGTKSQSKTANDTITFAFTGVKATVYGYKAPNHGIGAVSIDNGAETNLDFYNATTIGDQLMWVSPVLSAGNHTLKVRVLNTKSAASSDTYVVLDRIGVQATVACTTESDAAFCSRLAKNCGAVAGIDNCGSTRTVASCGTCAGGETCGNGICASSASNLFSNPSFSGGTSGWITYFYPGAGSFNTDTTGQDSSASARFNIPSTYSAGVDWHAHAYQTEVADGGPYTMSVWFQKAEGSSKKITAFCEEEGGAYTVYGSQECTNTTGWTQCTVTCTPPTGKLTKFGVSAAWDNVDVRIDNMMLVSGTGAPPPPPPSGAGAYGGTPAAIPGIIQAENYDLGGAGVAYSDTTAGNVFSTYRSDDVDVQSCGTGCYNLGAVAAGEWTQYTVNVGATGSYDAKLRVATTATGRALHLEIDGNNLGSIALPNTGAYTTYQDVVGPTVVLSAGTHLVRVVFETGSLNFEQISFTTTAPACVAETNAAFCSRLAKNCGSVTGTDNCGAARTAACGSCTSPQTCGAVTANVCDAPPAATNLFTNPSFASGTGTPWTTYFASGCAGSLAASTTAYDGDAKSAKITIGSYSSPSWDKAQVFQIKTANGAPYTLSAWFQKAEGTSKAATVFCSENGGAYTLWAQTNCTNTSGWTKCSVTCTPTSGKSVKFGIAVGANGDDVIIDAMSLTQ